MNTPTDYKQKAREFLSVASQFHLGELITEQPHHLTSDLSSLANDKCIDALKILHKIDSDALGVVLKNIDRIVLLAESIHATLLAGKSVFLCGCGATGRLSLTCETLWRMAHRGDAMENRVCGFMAGGDVALVRSIENFEDHPEYGARQLDELNFSDGDLLIGSTEGGETPYVIGATLRALEISSNQPFFLYCNPDTVLCKVAERSKQVIDDSRIVKINLTTGPMALAGSTRMQAATVLMATIGNALLWHNEPSKIREPIEQLVAVWNKLDIAFLEPFITEESSSYKRGDYVLYEADPALAMAILTDTTERSPTFSLHPFENILDSDPPHSLCYLYMPDAPDSRSAWEILLGRAPRALDWGSIGKIATYLRLIGFDFSTRCQRWRTQNCAAPHHHFRIKRYADYIRFDFRDITYNLSTTDLSLLDEHLLLKMLLNMHSTLVMGRLGRYQSNIMTWVRPSNNKLIDRTVRYVDILLQKKGVKKSFEEIVSVCFELIGSIGTDQSLVLAVVEKFSAP